MKKGGLLLLFIISCFSSFSQTSSSKVKWEFTVKEVEGKMFLECKATIAEHWHMYSQHINGDGPIPTTFTFKDDASYSRVGNVTEEKSKTTYDPNFDMEISFFEGTTVFRQEIKNNSDDKTTVNGSVEFMVCDDHMCYPPDVIDFSIELP